MAHSEGYGHILDGRGRAKGASSGFGVREADVDGGDDGSVGYIERDGENTL